jgi:hypothetical protein
MPLPEQIYGELSCGCLPLPILVRYSDGLCNCGVLQEQSNVVDDYRIPRVTQKQNDDDFEEYVFRYEVYCK